MVGGSIRNAEGWIDEEARGQSLVDGDYVLMDPGWLGKELGMTREAVNAWVCGSKPIPKRLCRTLESLTGVFEEAWRDPDKYPNRWLEIWRRKLKRTIARKEKKDVPPVDAPTRGTGAERGLLAR